MKRPNREDYPNGAYGDIEYDEKIEKYCTYLEQKLANNTEIIGNVSVTFPTDEEQDQAAIDYCKDLFSENDHKEDYQLEVEIFDAGAVWMKQKLTN